MGEDDKMPSEQEGIQIQIMEEGNCLYSILFFLSRRKKYREILRGFFSQTELVNV